MPVLGRFRVSLEHPTLDALDLGGAQTGLAPGADGQLLLNVVNLRAVVLAGFSYKRTSFPVRRALCHGHALWPLCLHQCMSMYTSSPACIHNPPPPPPKPVYQSWRVYGVKCALVLMQEVGDSGSLKLTATNGNVRLRLALSNDGAGR